MYYDEFGNPRMSVMKWISAITFFGSLNEFSSITLPEVSTVFIDPSAWIEFCSNPVMEILRLTVLFTKFTTWIEMWILHFRTERNLFERKGILQNIKKNLYLYSQVVLVIH